MRMAGAFYLHRKEVSLILLAKVALGRMRRMRKTNVSSVLDED
jgi:hypothetical protein